MFFPSSCPSYSNALFVFRSLIDWLIYICRNRCQFTITYYKPTTSLSQYSFCSYVLSVLMAFQFLLIWCSNILIWFHDFLWFMFFPSSCPSYSKLLFVLMFFLFLYCFRSFFSDVVAIIMFIMFYVFSLWVLSIHQPFTPSLFFLFGSFLLLASISLSEYFITLLFRL